MESRPLAFISRHHTSDGALADVSGGGGVVAVARPPPSLLQNEPDTSSIPNLITLSLSTYSAGEDAGRLAKLAKELGSARTRIPKAQLRKHAFRAFLRNHSHNVSEDASQTIRAEIRDSVDKEILSTAPASVKMKRPPLRFVFSGYSLWLELEQEDIDQNGRGDLDRAMIEAADEFSLGGAIPSPHVTALYGIENVAGEEDVRRLFREDLRKILLHEAEKRRSNGGNEHDSYAGKLWPDLAATGIMVGAEFDGVNGGTMDMAWAEISFSTSPEHEVLIDALHDTFNSWPDASTEVLAFSNAENKEHHGPRVSPWAPHLSLCYDNPEGYGPNLSRSSIEEFMKNKCPSLESILDCSGNDIKFTRAVSGISLWRTAGTMDQWKCLDRFEFSRSCT